MTTTPRRRTDPTPEQRAAFRAFVRRHHPDVGGDPETFRRGVAAFRTLGIVEGARLVDVDAAGATDPSRRGDRARFAPSDDDPRLDAPITAVSGAPLHRVGRAGARIWRHHPWYRSGRVV